MVGKIQINFTNKWFYTFALIIGIFALAVGVWAVAPNPGHTTSEIDWSGGLVISNAGEDLYLNTDTNNPSIELRDTDGSGLTPFIDFSNDGTIDYDARIRLLGDDTLIIEGAVLLGDGSGLTNIVARVTGAGTCDSSNDGLLRYTSGICSRDDFRESSFDICMRQTDFFYGWHNVQTYEWGDLSCDTDGCPPGEDYYECTGWVIEPGCYIVEPESCYCTGPEIICPE